MTAITDLAGRLWSLANTLRADGISYHQYVTELTLLLFLKMAKETEVESRLPKGCRWDDLLALPPGDEQLDSYKWMLARLGRADDPQVRDIYAGAQTLMREARHLNRLLLDIDKLDWSSAKSEQHGDLFELLLARNASESKSRAGQYFTPRPLIHAIVDVMKPQAGESIHDPAAGTAGFLIAADAYIKKQTDQLFALTEKQGMFQRRDAYVGVELVPEIRRMALMNCMLHRIEGEGAVRLGNTLTSDGATLPKANLVLTNPPFGTTKGAGGASRDDLAFPTSSRPLMFLQHIYRSLVPGGRAAVVLPDNVLFDAGRGREIRADLLDKCDLHTILRLPTGIFYAQGVKTNVLFFTRGVTERGNTTEVWVYDLRTNAPAFGKRTPFTREYLQPFVEAYGSDPNGKSERIDQGASGRFRCFRREEIAARGESLDQLWLQPEAAPSPVRGAELDDRTDANGSSDLEQVEEATGRSDTQSAAIIGSADMVLGDISLSANATLTASAEVISAVDGAATSPSRLGSKNALVAQQRGPYRDSPMPLRQGLHPRTAELLLDRPRLSESATLELDELIRSLWNADVPPALVDALGQLKLQRLDGALPWMLWGAIDAVDAAFNAAHVAASVALQVQRLLADARYRARQTYTAGLIAAVPVGMLAVALGLMGFPPVVIASVIGFAALCIGAGAHALQRSNQHIADLSRMINDLKPRIPELQPVRRGLPGATDDEPKDA